MSVDVSIPHENDTVGRLHAELSELPDGQYYLLDKQSVNGTYIYSRNGWEKINNAYVTLETRVRFGEYEMTISAIVNQQGHKSKRESFTEDVREQFKKKVSRDIPPTSHRELEVIRPYYDTEKGEMIIE